MRIKILLLGDDPVSLMADSQLLKERGMLVFTAFNLDNLSEIITEVTPDAVFFDPQKESTAITNAYNNLVNENQVPVIYALAEDELYLVTRKRTGAKDKKHTIADNMINAVKMALSNTASYEKSSKIIVLSNMNPAGGTFRA